MEGWMEREGERGRERESGSAGQIRLWGFFFFSLLEIVSLLLKCMFEVGAQLNTSCLKKTDARVEQEMRERPKKREREKRLGEDREGSMRKNMHRHSQTNIWKEHEVILQDMNIHGEGQKGGLQWHKVDVAAEIQYAANVN